MYLDASQFLESTKQLIGKIPQTHLATLRYIIAFFYSFTKKSNGKVKIANFGAFFGPSLLHFDDLTIESVSTAPRVMSVFSRIAEYARDIGLYSDEIF